MKTSTRLFALLLTLCLIMSMVVPAVYAAPASEVYNLTSDNSEKLSFFYNSGKTPNAGYTQTAPNESKSFHANSSENFWTYLHQAYTYRQVLVDSTGLTLAFAGSDADATTNKCPFVAIQINVETAGAYNMEFTMNPNDNGGLTQVFVLTEDDYTSNLINGYTLNSTTGISGGYLPGLYTKMQELAINKQTKNLNVLNSCTGADATQSIGTVNFTGSVSGNYVLVFRCYGASTISTVNARLSVKALTLKPTALATVNETPYYTTETAIEAIKNSETSGNVTLYANIETDTDIAVSSNITTFDLNGCDLTAKRFTYFSGTVIQDTNSDTRGVLKAEAISWVKNTNKTGEGYFPLYNSIKEGYSFYKATITPQTYTDHTVVDGVESAKFWFNLKFDHSSAYDLIAANTSKLIIVPYIEGKNGTDKVTANPSAPSTFYPTWAETLQDNENYSIVLTVKNLQLVDSGTFYLLPRIRIQPGGTSDSRIEIQSAAISLPALSA